MKNSTNFNFFLHGSMSDYDLNKLRKVMESEYRFIRPSLSLTDDGDGGRQNKLTVTLSNGIDIIVKDRLMACISGFLHALDL